MILGRGKKIQILRSLVVLLVIVLMPLSSIGDAEAQDGETRGGDSKAGGEDLLLEPASMVLEVPLEPSPVKPQDTAPGATGWQNIMTDGFEGAFPGVKWQLFGNPTWGKDGYNPYSGSYSAFCAKGGTAGVNPPSNYPTNMIAWMVYGPFSLAGTTDAELNFYAWLDSEYQYDHLMCMASINGTNFAGWQWSGNSGGWVSKSFDLTDVYTLGNLCGEPQVWIAFIFQSDEVVTDNGAFIDDVVLSRYVTGPVEGFVDVLSVDPSLFCKIWTYVSVDTVAGMAGTLTEGDFEVYEDGVKQTIESFEFASDGVTSKADILFVFDDTGSMYGEIGIMKTKCKELTDAIEAAGIDARYALVSFSDSPETDQGWTGNAAVFKAAVDALSASGGGDEPEDDLDAIEMGLGLGFRADAQKVVIDITDAHTHYRGDGSGYADYTMPEVEDDLISQGVSLFVVSPDFGTTSTTVTDNQGMAVEPTSSPTDNDKKILAEDVGGVWLDINAADFDEILDGIVGVITTAYHIDYTTTNCVEDCTTRTVQVVVHDPAQGTDSDTGIYKAPCEGFVDVLSVDPSLFCKIWTYVSVDTVAGRAGSLTVDDFEVYEDGVKQTIESFEFASDGVTSKVDILFVFDDTGSMGGEIGTMKTKCKELTDAIEAAGIDARYALVSFGDSPETDQGWTGNAAVFKAAVDALSASGGADEPEDDLDAIEMGLGLGFRADAQKVVIDITDAHTHYRGDGSGYADYTMPEVEDDLISQGVSLFVVSPDFGTTSTTVTDNQGMTVPLISAPTDNDKKILAQEVGGLWLDIDAADFDEILDGIVGVITTAYHIDYTTTNCVEDCTTRTVQVVVHDPAQGTGSDTGIYKAPCRGAGASVSIEPQNQTVPPGGSFIVDVVIDSAGLLVSACDVAVTFDADLTATAAIGNPLLGSPVLAIPMDPTIAVGSVSWAVTRTGGNAPAAVNGSLMTIHFDVSAEAEGTYPLNIDATLVDESVSPIAAVENDGQVTVGGRKGDFDGDGDIDIFDFVNFAAAYGSVFGDDNYNAAGDFEPDGDIDIFDFVQFAAVYGT